MAYSRLYLVSLLLFFLAVMTLATFAIASSWQNLFLERDDIAYIDLQEEVPQIGVYSGLNLPPIPLKLTTDSG